MDIDLREDDWLRVISDTIPAAKGVLRYHFSPLFRQIGVNEQQGEEIIDSLVGMLRRFGAKAILDCQSW